MQRFAPALVALSFSLVGASTVHADPVRIVTAGSVYTGNYDTGFNLHGSNFTFMVSQWLEPIVNCERCTP